MAGDELVKLKFCAIQIFYIRESLIYRVILACAAREFNPEVKRIFNLIDGNFSSCLCWYCW